MEEFIPNKFEFIIGSFDSSYCIIEIKDNKLTHSFSVAWGKSNPFSATQVIPTQSEWKKFWIRVEDLQVWKWKKDYSDPDTCDGVQWSLKMKLKKKTLNTYGCNSYPESFDQFKNAISDLLGGLPFNEN